MSGQPNGYPLFAFSIAFSAYAPMQDVAPSAVRIAVATEAIICAIYFTVLSPVANSIIAIFHTLYLYFHTHLIFTAIDVP